MSPTLDYTRMCSTLSAARRVACAVVIYFVMTSLAIGEPGHWSSIEDYDEFEEDIDKEVPCPDPAKVVNGETIVWGEGMLLEYRCKAGYSPVGITHGACDLKTGTWTIEPPVCTDQGCPPLSPPSHGIVKVDSGGGLATIVCRPGYFLIGDSTLVCEEGQWKGSYPACAVTQETNEHTKSRRGQGENTVLKRSYSIPGITLDDSDETCFYNHVTPPEIQNAVVETTYIMNEAKHRYVMVATYRCMGGYKLRNHRYNTLFCKNLIWTAPRMPECVADDDSCEEDNGGCSHYCTPLGSKKFACSCYDGYRLEPDAKTCNDTDECAIDNGGCQHECINTEGSFFCTCTEGFQSKGLKCVDVDECVKKENQCPGPCINTPGSFHCDCNITGFQPSKTNDYCEDSDECTNHNGGCDDVCLNKRGSYECRCESKGRKLGEDGHSCVDIDECTRYKGRVCANGVCLNNDGSFTCICNHGYRQTRNDSFCEDLDECLVDNGGCEQLCENKVGSFACACRKGYALADDKVSCKDVNECLVKNAGCQDMCINTEGSYRCSCTHVGRVLSTDGSSCKECLPNQYFNRSTWSCNDCPEHAHARDPLALTVKDCKCNKGFHGAPAQGIECQDTNECYNGELRCLFQCVNTVGSAYCTCPKGFKTDDTGVHCTDINECDSGSHSCSQLCYNTNGSYSCECRGGYLLDKDRLTCIDIDECVTNTPLCPHICINTIGSYTCLCKDGYDVSEDGRKCEDINECKKEPAPCSQLCNNTEGSYTCSCDGPGFKLSKDLSTCLDINECMEGDNPCPNICINTIGSYLCDCDRPGYQLASDSSGCEDINECISNPCPHKCINTLGSFKCICPLGFADPPETNQTVCNECPVGTYRGVEDTSCKRCPSRTNTSSTGSSSIKDCVCKDGYKADPMGSGLCLDVNECKTGQMSCQHSCVNTEGSAHCTCRPGFVLDRDGLSCYDINECEKQNGGCEHKCVNTPGSFMCECRSESYKLADNGLSCEDINECQTSSHGCEYRCVNTPSGAKCTCPQGYELINDAKSCRDIDECRSRNGGCTDVCINTPGSYTCKCTRPGYKLYTDHRQCVDINECEVDKTTCEDLCVNTVGSFKCYCRQAGYTLSQDKRSCEDVDECARGKICQQLCINLPGSFRCDCLAGYYKQGHHCTACPVGSYRSRKDSVISCAKCPPGMTTAGKATESVLGCYCPPGFHGNPETLDKCTDINECSKSSNGGCEQICNNTEGSYLCSCAEGYALDGDKRSCSPTRCPLLKPPQFAKFVSKACLRMNKGHHVPPGTECFFQCRKFMILRGLDSRKCLDDFTWSAGNPECHAPPCERLPVPENGYLYPPVCMLPRVPFRTRCSFRCNKDYQSVGSAGAKCKATGKWNGKINHRCVPKQGR